MVEKLKLNGCVCVCVYVFVYMSIVCMYICETLAKGLKLKGKTLENELCLLLN